jgi:hypothetical protein
MNVKNVINPAKGCIVIQEKRFFGNKAGFDLDKEHY